MERFKQFARSNVCVLAFQKKRKANNQLVFGQPRTGIRLGSSAQRALEGRMKAFRSEVEHPQIHFLRIPLGIGVTR